jgi:uncharacterized protein
MIIKVENIQFKSDENTLLGRIFYPNIRKKSPAVVMCHGYPGNTKNTDLAEELALNGIAALIFYYQGAWGSTGNYKIMSLEVGARDAIAYLRTLKQVNSNRVGLISHSMGALPLTKIMSMDTTIRTGIMTSPANINEIGSSEALGFGIDHYIKSAEGRLRGVSVESIMSGLLEAYEKTNPVKLVPKIKAPIMVIAASNDVVVSPDSCRKIYDAANEPKKWAVVEGADHDYSEHREPMMRLVLNRLRETL